MNERTEMWQVWRAALAESWGIEAAIERYYNAPAELTSYKDVLGDMNVEDIEYEDVGDDDFNAVDSQNEAEQAPVEWRVHDRTHLEFAIDYPINADRSEYTWEAYFFFPESFRLHEETYDKKAIYEDLWSYVRYAVPPIPFWELASQAEGTGPQRHFLGDSSQRLGAMCLRGLPTPQILQAARGMKG